LGKGEVGNVDVSKSILKREVVELLKRLRVFTADSLKSAQKD